MVLGAAADAECPARPGGTHGVSSQGPRGPVVQSGRAGKCQEGCRSGRPRSRGLVRASQGRCPPTYLSSQVRTPGDDVGSQLGIGAAFGLGAFCGAAGGVLDGEPPQSAEQGRALLLPSRAAAAAPAACYTQPQGPGRDADARRVPGRPAGPGSPTAGAKRSWRRTPAAGQPACLARGHRGPGRWTLHQLRRTALTHDAEGGTSTPILQTRSRYPWRARTA